jgi:anti-anti-sigma factor
MILLRFGKDCYINSGGLAFLIDIASEGRKKGQKIAATGLSDHFQKIFHMVGLTRCISVHATEEDALKELK